MTKIIFDATFDLNDFLNQSYLITNMRSFASIARMIHGIGCQINAIGCQINAIQITQV